MQAKPGYELSVLLTAGEQARVPFAVAGGVGKDSIGSVQRAGADVAVAGGSICGAAVPAQAARELREAII